MRHLPWFSGTRDVNFEMPVDDNLWEAQSEKEWQRLIATHANHQRANIANALSRLMFGNNTEVSGPVCADIFAFAATVIMHAVDIHLYCLAHNSRSLDGVDIHTNVEYAMRLSQH